MPNFFSQAVFSNILRFLIKAAQDKRVVPYNELENIFGLSHNMAGYYAGMVGEFCLEHDWPLLNSLVVNTTHCKPSGGFDHYEGISEQSWGDCLAECWQKFHMKTSREQQVRNYSGLTQLVRDWDYEGAPASKFN